MILALYYYASDSSISLKPTLVDFALLYNMLALLVVFILSLIVSVCVCMRLLFVSVFSVSCEFRFNRVWYILGELMYAYITCQPDIGYAVTTLSKFSTSPSAYHYKLLKGVAKYLRSTILWGIR